MIHDERTETMDRAELEQVQIERLQSTLNRAARNVAFYRERFAEHDVDPDAVDSLDALRRTPLTTRDDLREAHPYDMFAVPLNDVVRIHSSSGTTGRPVGIGYTRNDLRMWSDLVARGLAAADVDEHDTLQVAFGYSLFTGGFGFHQGAELLGASVIPSSNEEPARQIDVMRDYRTTALACTPSYALRLAAAVEAADLHPDALSLRVGFFGAEPWSETVRAEIEKRLRIEAFDTYGVSELLGPGVSFECGEHDGLHVNEDCFIVEVVDPETGEPLPDGEEGELVFTTVTREAFPLIRYRTGDRASLLPGDCPCGRGFRRMSRVAGRCDDMIVVGERRFFPSHVDTALMGVEGIEHDYRIIISRKDDEETVTIEAAIRSDFPFDEVRRVEALRGEMTERLAAAVGVTPRIEFVQPSALRGAGHKKTVTVVDTRNRPA